jgi:uncharacterized membrane protein YkvA (DUF1232 family)
MSAPRTPGEAVPAPAVRALLGRLPAYGRLYWRLLRQGELGPGQQALALAALAYTVSPIDLVPGVIPVVGQMDDLAVALLGLRLLLRRMPPAAAERHLAAVGLSLAQLDADLATLGQTALTLGYQGLRLAGKAARASARGLATLLAGMPVRRRAPAGAGHREPPSGGAG